MLLLMYGFHNEMFYMSYFKNHTDLTGGSGKKYFVRELEIAARISKNFESECGVSHMTSKILRNRSRCSRSQQKGAWQTGE